MAEPQRFFTLDLAFVRREAAAGVSEMFQPLTWVASALEKATRPTASEEPTASVDRAPSASGPPTAS